MFTEISFYDCWKSLVQFWLIVVVVPSEIKSKLENEFDSLGGERVGFYVLSKKLIFQ